MTLMKELKKIYVKNRVDVLGFRITAKNPATYHHIIEVWELKLLGFPTTPTLENGIVLSEVGHAYLHLIEYLDPITFNQINKIILLITKERRLPTEKERDIIEFYMEYFEYEICDYYDINEKCLKRERKKSKQEKIDHC